MTWKLRGGGKSNKKKRTQKKYKSASFSKLVKQIQTQFYLQLVYKASLSFTLMLGPCSGKQITVLCILVQMKSFPRFGRNHPYCRNKWYLILFSLRWSKKNKKKPHFPALSIFNIFSWKFHGLSFPSPQYARSHARMAYISF